MLRYLIAFGCILLLGSAHAVESSEQLQLLIDKKQYSEAVRSGEKILLQNPGDARARFLTAYAYQMNSNTDKAVLLYQELIRDNPSLPEPRNNLAMIHLARGDYDRASELLMEAINTHSSYATAYDNLNRVYKGIASEAYRRAVSESSEPAKYTHDIQLTAITTLESIADAATALQQLAALPKPTPASKATVDAPMAIKPAKNETANAQTGVQTTGAGTATASPQPEPTIVNTANQKTLLIEQVRNWASAWSSKQFDTYTSAYSKNFRAQFATHNQWVKHRRSRILRPGEIQVVVSDFAVKLRAENRASVDFIQAFSSPGYRDRVVKRLDFSRIGAQWKITAERVLSVL